MELVINIRRYWQEEEEGFRHYCASFLKTNEKDLSDDIALRGNDDQIRHLARLAKAIKEIVENYPPYMPDDNNPL